jgi:hypothetical protein
MACYLNGHMYFYRQWKDSPTWANVMGHVMAQAVSRCPLIAEAWLQSQASPVHVGIVVDEVAMAQDFSEYFGFPCQYHSTNTSYSFIHLSPTLCNLSNW